MCKDSRFSRTGAERTWKTLTAAGRVQILDDSLTDEAFTKAVSRISGMPASERMRSKTSWEKSWFSHMRRSTPSKARTCSC